MVEKDNSKISVLIVSRANKVKRLSFPKWFPRVGLSVLVSTIFISIIYMSIVQANQMKLKLEAKELSRILASLEEDNKNKTSELSRIKSENKILQSKTIEVDEKLNEIEELQKEVERITGAKPPSRGGSQGRTVDIHRLQPEESMEFVSEVLDDTKLELENYLESVKDRLDYLDCLPNLSPTYGRLTSRFGGRRDPINRRYSYHSGIDLANSSGTSIRAAGRGKVIFAGYKRGLGNTVIIDHGYGYKSLYGHNSRLLVKVGDRVSKGQTISRMGSSGRSTGSHLHFEIHKNNVPINPYTVLK